MPGRVLHILSQRPGRTGSGVTLDNMVRLAAAGGWQQAVVVGVPAPETPAVGGLAPDFHFPVRFSIPDGGPADLDFPVPGMSDVMPYPSTVWSTMTAEQLHRYRRVWRRHLTRVINAFQPDLIHSHHVWLVSSLIKDIAPAVPVVTTCHSTGLRQMALTPHLADEVRRGCARNDHFCVLRADHAKTLGQTLQVAPDRITVVGAGYRPDLFYRDPQVTARSDHWLYVGKYSRAKGLPWLLDAVTRLTKSRPELRLHIAGGGAGPEAEALDRRLDTLAPHVVKHGQLAQPELAALARRCGVCVLPSFYEGVPLVLVEAAACGCRLVATALPGVRERIQPHLADHLDLVPLPRLEGSDRPLAADLPAFVDELTAALLRAMERHGSMPAAEPEALAPFTWQSVFGRVETIWQSLLR